VPPLSSHLTPVFHLEMLNYALKPSYEYQVYFIEKKIFIYILLLNIKQESAYKLHVWKQKTDKTSENKRPKRKVYFSDIARYFF
jgi:hypothetical protein